MQLSLCHKKVKQICIAAGLLINRSAKKLVLFYKKTPFYNNADNVQHDVITQHFTKVANYVQL